MPSAANEFMFKEIGKEFKTSRYTFISNFEGLSVSVLSDLRQKLNKVSNRSMLVKHSLAKKIFEGIKVSEAEKFLKGSVLLTFSVQEEPQVVSKAIMEFSKANGKFFSSGVIFENKVYDAAFVKQLADLPSRHELLTQLVVQVKSPITGVVLTLNQILRGLVVALNEVKKLREVQPQAA